MFGSMQVWYNQAEIANVVSLKMVKNMFRVIYNSDDRGGVFTVHTDKGTIEFAPHLKGLHYFDLDQCKAKDM